MSYAGHLLTSKITFTQLLKPKYPEYVLNFQIKGYDFPVLESYQKYLHRVAMNFEYMDCEVEDSWALPPKVLKIQRFKPKASVVDSEYTLKVYERTLQLCNLKAHLYPTFLRLAQEALPEGVELSVEEHTHDVEELRFVPDRELIELKNQLEDMRKHK